VNTDDLRSGRRLEDHRLLTGTGRYVADLITSDDLHAHFHRSPVAHGVLGDIDVETAAGMAGVVSVYVGEGLGLPPIGGGVHAGEGHFERPLLAAGKVRYVGEPVAMVIAGAKAEAVDAADMIWADIEPLDAVTDPIRAAGHPVSLFEEGNLVFQGTAGSEISDREFPVSASVTVHNQRVAPASIEGLAIRVEPSDVGGLSVYCGHQAPHRLRAQLAVQLGLDPAAVRVVVPDVGGAFGMKGALFPEYVLVAAAALEHQRPVVWIEDRREHFQSGTHGRGQTHRVTLEGEANGRIRRARIEIVADLGAYPHTGSHIPHLSTFVAQGLYDIEEVAVEISGVVTNLAPTGSYRGAGRPEAAFAIERAVDEFAAATGLDPAEVRRRNFVRSDQLPYANQTGATYDSGDYARALDAALALADIDSVRAEQERRRRVGGDPIGVGIGTFVERAGGATGTGEFGHVRIGSGGMVEVLTGSTSAGQGHETVWSQLVAPMFGVPAEDIVVIAGDTGLVAEGVGTFASRSAQLTGSALVRMAEVVITEMKEKAAALLEAAVDDLVLSDGRVHVAGDPQSGVSFSDLAGTESSEMFVPDSQTFPYGAHVAVVEVSLATGELSLRRYVAVDDCGNVLNPMIVHGQVVGSLVQGYGQAVLEGIEYTEGGDPVTSSFMDYLIPAALDTPTFTLGRTFSPAPSNPLGVKGTGEAGCIGAPPAIVNAAVDALRPYGVSDLQMPLRPHRLWEAIRGASAGGDRPQ
jgi:aerobic carbon-monoxide dehydrogenase large subunit